MKIVEDFKSLLSKGNGLGYAVAIGYVVGTAVISLTSTINSCIVDPLLDMITGGGEGISKLDVKYLKFGHLLEGLIEIAVLLAVAYAVFCIVLPKFGGSSSSIEKTSAPPPPPPVA